MVSIINHTYLKVNIIITYHCFLLRRSRKTSQFTYNILFVDDIKELEKITVTTNGEIDKPANKVFSASVIEKKNLTQHTKLQESIKKCNIQQLANSISNCKPLFLNNVQYLNDKDNDKKQNRIKPSLPKKPCDKQVLEKPYTITSVMVESQKNGKYHSSNCTISSWFRTTGSIYERK